MWLDSVNASLSVPDMVRAPSIILAITRFPLNLLSFSTAKDAQGGFSLRFFFIFRRIAIYLWVSHVLTIELQSSNEPHTHTRTHTSTRYEQLYLTVCLFYCWFVCFTNAFIPVQHYGTLKIKVSHWWQASAFNKANRLFSTTNKTTVVFAAANMLSLCKHAFAL